MKSQTEQTITRSLEYHHTETVTGISTSREGRFDSDFHPYMMVAPHDKSPVNSTEMQRAFACGYVNALHRTHTFDELLFVGEEQLITSVQSKFMHSMSLLSSLDLDLSIRSRFCIDPKMTDSKFPRFDLTNAFVYGYVFGIHQTGKYDRCLFLKGAALHAQVFADLLAEEKKDENARRAAARIVLAAMPRDNKPFRAMLTDERIDDNGNPVPPEV